MIDYNEPNITGEYQALPKEMLNEKQQQMKKNKNKNTCIIFSGYSVHVVAGVKMTDFSTLSYIPQLVKLPFYTPEQVPLSPHRPF